MNLLLFFPRCEVIYVCSIHEITQTLGIQEGVITHTSGAFDSFRAFLQD